MFINDESIFKLIFIVESEDIWYCVLVILNVSKLNKDISIDYYIFIDFVCNENFFCFEKI